jgi:hypothetical protein
MQVIDEGRVERGKYRVGLRGGLPDLAFDVIGCADPLD